MKRQLRVVNRHIGTIINIWLIGSVGSGQMSVQLSVEKEANKTLYTGSGVSEGY